MGHMGENRTGFKRRYTVPEAARVLGISPEAVRTRLSRGTLEGVRDGGRVFVLLEHDITSSDADITGDQTELVESLRDQVAFLRSELERRADEAAEHRRIIAALTQRIPEIEAPREPSGATEPPGTPSEATPQPGRVEPQPAVESTQEPAQPRSWWRRVFGG
jgi:hypothetical protein